MPPRQARSRERSLTGAREAHGASGIHEEGDGENHQESVMRGGTGGNVGSAPPAVLGGAEFMQVVFTAIKQVAFLQLRPPTFRGEPDLLVAEDELEQVTRALDTILVTEEELRVLFASYQLQGDALQWWKTVEECVAKKWEPFKKAFLDQYFIDTAKEALRMEFINLVQGKEEEAKQFIWGLRPSIRNKIAGNLIKVYSTMVSAATAIEETLNETMKITNPKSQREGNGNYSIICPDILGRVDLFWLSPAGAPCCGLPTDRAAAVVATEGSTPLLGTGTVTDFISVQTTGCGSAELENSGAGLRYDISSGTVGDNRAAGATVGYLCCTRLVDRLSCHDRLCPA
ncbi:hypothetical protein Acr_00g0020820 [Actinidia rufa]|uniref:Retrotransposon gag domain-containing protein n=1 Tax=Actinidia rufa TaxID=165716 RepID=A0A7J0DDG4_9ERIC|nr:hypothetical protein Acr_00g0020820 [Actinidia rufa]